MAIRVWPGQTYSLGATRDGGGVPDVNNRGEEIKGNTPVILNGDHGDNIPFELLLICGREREWGLLLDTAQVSSSPSESIRSKDAQWP
jgi:hypothetical protein